MSEKDFEKIIEERYILLRATKLTGCPMTEKDEAQLELLERLLETMEG